LSRHIVFWSLGTPLSNEHYLNATRGNLYGIEKSPSQVGPLGFTSKTEFEGLFLCGQSTTSHGVAGVTASGVDAAKAVLNCRTRDLLTGKGGGLRLYSADGVTDARMEGTDGEVERMEGEV
jgi:phytoene dehydrogenase-like protein